MNDSYDELKLVVWKDETKWLWHIEKGGEVIKGKRVSGEADTFQEAYDDAKQRYNHERRKEDA